MNIFTIFLGWLMFTPRRSNSAKSETLSYPISYSYDIPAMKASVWSCSVTTDLMQVRRIPIGMLQISFVLAEP